MEKLDVMNLIQANWALRALLREIRRHNSGGLTRGMQGRIDAALSQQDEPAPAGWVTCSPELLDSGVCCATAPRIPGAPGSGISHYHPAPAQDEREMGELRIRLENGRRQFEFEEYDAAYSLPAGTHYLYTRPAQTEQQPIGWITEDYLTDKSATTYSPEVADRWRAKGWPVSEIYADPISQAAPQPEQSGLVEAWSGMKAIPVSAVEYEAIYRHNIGASPTSVVPGDGMTAKSGVSYIVSAALSTQGDKP